MFLPTADTAAPTTESPEDLAAEREAHLELFTRAVRGTPRFHARPNVLPIVGQPGKFALIDPATVDHSNPKNWNSQSGKTGLATKASPHGERSFDRPVLGKAYPKNSPNARIYTTEEIERMQSTIDPDASGLTLADQVSEGLYDQFVKAIADAGVAPGARTTFALRFAVARFDLAVYAKQSTDDAKAVYLANAAKHAVAAMQVKEELFRAYDRKIADAEDAGFRTREAPDAMRIANLETQLAAVMAKLAAIEAKPAGQ